MNQCTKFLDEQFAELQSDIATLTVLESQFGGWKKELVADLQGFQIGTTRLVRNQGQRWKILLQRMNLVNFHYSLLIDRATFDEELNNIGLVIGSHGQKNLKEDILSLVEEIS
jgi:hypothetical protein